MITVEGQAPEQKKTACYDIDVEVDDTLKVQMNSFLLSTNSQMEIQNLDNKIHETVETINTMKTQREFYLSFSKDPQLFINKWLTSQSRGKSKLFTYSILKFSDISLEINFGHSCVVKIKCSLTD